MSRRVKRSRGGRIPVGLHENSLLDLPIELLDHILSYLSGKELNSLRLICSHVRDIVDESSVWRRKRITLTNIPPASLSTRWQLLAKRRISAIDICEVQCSQKELEMILSNLPLLRHLWLNADALLALAYLQCQGLMEHITKLGILELSTFTNIGWAPFVMTNLKGISHLSIHSFHGSPSRLIKEMAKLEKLETLDVEFNAHSEQDIEVDTEVLAPMLYSLKNLTSLRIHNIALDSDDGFSPFDPKTCPSKLGIPSDRLLKLKKLELRVILTDNNDESEYNQLSTDDLKYMPQLKTLRYGICQDLMGPYTDTEEIDTDKWNFSPEDGARTPALEELHIHFDRGTKHSGTQFGWLVKLPKSLKCLSFQGNIPPIQPVLVAVGATLGATLRDLRIRTYALLGEADLDYISRYFVRLESLTCGVMNDTRPESLLMLSRIPRFAELRLTSYIDETTINLTKDNMKKFFIISKGT